ncbi:O-antigen ligase family protein [Phytoactinopolyspora halotolerans]|uniref:O-antigen ligase family protein n=2 Tax=Phytoactinopolyspora halotolerans TaxID=1981512 RepID=A0A6L9S4P1_9ACTN|nr:O-antigen ligase family protein [Phytoactinopolyspora halotolerans]
MIIGSRPLTALILLVIFLALQFLIPARLVIGGMGAIGRPSVAIGLLLFFLWTLAFLTRRGLPDGAQPVRWIIGGYVAFQLFGYAVGIDRGLPEIEASSADRWIIFTFAMAGVALATADGMRTRHELDRLLRALVGFAAVMGVIGGLQFTQVVDITQYVRIPGLRLNAALIGVAERGGPGFPRVASTATHYIEFGVVLAMVLPLALHYALFATVRRQRVWRWLAVAVIAVGIPFSISRSATLAVGLALVLMLSVWPWRQRYNALVIAACAIAMFHVVQRGVLGTIKSLFANVENDPSVQDRIARTDYVFELWAERPWIGRGAGTFMPERYILLDNQLYMTLLEGGAVGLAALVVFFLAPYFVARSLRLRGADQETRHLAQALAVVLPVSLLASGTFDSFSFATFVGVLFVVIGAIGALWRIDGGGGGRRPLQVAALGDRLVATPWMANWSGAGRRSKSESLSTGCKHGLG